VSIRDSYNAIAEKYDNLFSDRSFVAEEIMLGSMLGSFMSKTEYVLDIGCGTGVLLSIVEIEPSRYAGVDISEGMLKIMSSEHPDYVSINKEFDISDADGFDLIVGLFGSPSYMSPDVIRDVIGSGRSYFLMFYAEDYNPITYRKTGISPESFAFSEYSLKGERFSNYLIVTNRVSSEAIRKADSKISEVSGTVNISSLVL